jgi:hypothetical protein
MSLSLKAWGRRASMQLPEPAEPIALGRRVEYRRGPLTEWYVNDERGLEQGFTIDARPAGEGPLQFAIALGEGLEAEVEPGGRDAVIVDPETGDRLHYSGLSAWDAAHRDLQATLAVAGGQLTIKIDDQGALYPVQVDPWIAIQEAEFQGSGHFGEAVSLSGDTALVGDWSSKGRAFVFVRNGSGWSQQEMLEDTFAMNDDEFGRSVSLSGNTALIGAPGRDHAGGTDAGMVYVFARRLGTWTLMEKLMASDGKDYEHFGCSVSLMGDTALIGAKDVDLASEENAGSAYVFVRTGPIWAVQTTWVEQAKLMASEPKDYDHFGEAVSLGQDTALIGAPTYNQIGSAYVFTRSGTSWSEQQELVAGDQVKNRFGASVALFGDTAVIGARGDDEVSNDAGASYVFVRNGTSWFEQQKLLPSNFGSAFFGDAVAIEDGTIAIGAPGGSYVAFFQQSSGTWSQVFLLSGPSKLGSPTRFGGALGLSGETILVGADGANSALVYRFAPGPVSYCTPGTSASGCQALISAGGTPSATESKGFTLLAAGVEGQRNGLFFFGTSGSQANPWGNGTSYQCVVQPVRRAGAMPGTGTLGACDGSFVQDLNALWCPSCPKPAVNPGAGALVQAQLWYRDPQSTSNQTTSLSDAIEFGVGL